MTKVTRKIVAIGGGEISDSETLAIDQEIIRLTGKKHPKLLFIPTASSDSEGYYQAICDYFGAKLGCSPDALYLLGDRPSPSAIRDKIFGADFVYVGGGNALKMMRRWRLVGVDKLLRLAWERGVVMSGLSAGSICWFDSGHSDSQSFYNPDNWKYMGVRGLRFIRGVHCPHFNSETLGVSRADRFSEFISDRGGIGIALDDNCAIEVIDDKYRIISSQPQAKAFIVYKQGGQVVQDEIVQDSQLKPIASLYSF